MSRLHRLLALKNLPKKKARLGAPWEMASVMNGAKTGQIFGQLFLQIVQ